MTSTHARRLAAGALAALAAAALAVAVRDGGKRTPFVSLKPKTKVCPDAHARAAPRGPGPG